MDVMGIEAIAPQWCNPGVGVIVSRDCSAPLIASRSDGDRALLLEALADVVLVIWHRTDNLARFHGPRCETSVNRT